MEEIRGYKNLMDTRKETLVVVDAGPAGLTAAYELATRGDYNIIVFEANNQVRGISKTVDNKGNKIDIGGHRFFSKSDWVLEWWQPFLPILNDSKETFTTYQNRQKAFETTPFTNASKPHMSIRHRKSRVYYNHEPLDYPIKFNLNRLMEKPEHTYFFGG